MPASIPELLDLDILFVHCELPAPGAIDPVPNLPLAGHPAKPSYRNAGAEREEVAQQLRYVNALLTELLPPETQVKAPGTTH